MDWSVQISGSSCFFSAIHLDADGLYVNAPKFKFSLPSTIAELVDFPDVLNKLVVFKNSIYSIAVAVEESLTSKHCLERALGRASGDETDRDTRIYWICDSHCSPPSSILPKFLKTLHAEEQEEPFVGCVFDESGWALIEGQGYWFNAITKAIQVFAFRKREIDRWRRMSEGDLFKNIWSPIVDIVFEGSPIVITCGDTWLSSLTAGKDERNPYKVDLRLILESLCAESPSKLKSHSIASCEVSKNGKVARKTTNDNKKLMVEGKIILDLITKNCSLSFKAASKLKVVNLQLSVQIKYAKDKHGYVTQTVGHTIMFPTAKKYFGNFFAVGLPNLLYWRDRAEKNLKILQEGLHMQ